VAKRSAAVPLRYRMSGAYNGPSRALQTPTHDPASLRFVKSARSSEWVLVLVGIRR
jgi:hypothetical protein